jgi:hypothetical protein
VIANETVGGRELLKEIERRTERSGGQAELLVVAPALIESRLKAALGDVDPAREKARERLEGSVAAMRRDGVDVRGAIGDQDPNQALIDALRTFPADEVIIATHPPERSLWLEKDVVERARNEIDLPITHVVVDLDRSGSPHIEAVERIPPRPRPEGDADAEGTDYLPPMPFRDRITLLVGIVGTIVLGILAIVCPDGGTISGGCAARILIAIGAFMITLWHTVALLIMGSLRYRGIWASAAADIVLFGIPPAIVLSLLLG